MTTTHSTLLVLLDLLNEHQNFEQLFDLHLFRRYTDRNQCLSHISSHVHTTRLLHFFLPKSEHVIIGAEIVMFNTIYYIYCVDQASMNEMRQRYNQPMFVKILHMQSLPTYLQQAAICHLTELADRSLHQPDERDIALQTAIELTKSLANELHKHIQYTVGTQPED